MNPDRFPSVTEKASSTTTLAGALAFEILAKREKALQDRIDQRSSSNPPPRTYSYLSAVEECDRQMVYAVTHPNERAPIAPDLKARFEAGELQENQIIIELRQMGYAVVLQQESVVIKNRAGDTIGRGKVDGHILYHGLKVPIEIKSMHPQIFESVDDLTDFRRKPHLRRYLRQMAMYLYGNNVEEGLFIVTDCLGHWKVLVVTLDYAEGEQILQRLERVHDALKTGALPERIAYREEVCGKCPWATICLPDVMRKELNFLADEDLILSLERREATKVAASTYKAADRWVKDYLNKHKIEKGLAGDFMIVGKSYEVKEKVIPASTATRFDIQRITKPSAPLQEAL